MNDGWFWFWSIAGGVAATLTLAVDQQVRGAQAALAAVRTFRPVVPPAPAPLPAARVVRGGR